MKRVLRFWPLVATMYFCVSGGPHGLESVMQNGFGVGILLILVTPILWAVPAALMTAELSSAIPAEGGYYVWVRRGLGPFPGFLCGWWTWVYSWVDVAIYPALFAGYVHTTLQLAGINLPTDKSPLLKWAVGLIVIVPLTALNIRGTRLVGRTALVFFAALLAPFVLLVIFGAPKLAAHPSIPLSGPITGQNFAAGLFVVLWNYLGWDSMSTVAAETEDPSRAFPRALGVTVPLVTLTYVLPALVGAVYLTDPTKWTDGCWTEVGRLIGGPKLGFAVAAAGIIATAGLFSSTLLASSRIPFAIAEDRILPDGLTRLHPRYGTPWVAILVSAGFYTLFSFASFKQLAEVDVIVYSSGLLLEFAALVALRIKEPEMPRPYRIPGGWFGVGLVSLLPLTLLLAAIWDQLHPKGEDAVPVQVTLGFTALALLSGPLVYAVYQAVRKRA